LNGFEELPVSSPLSNLAPKPNPFVALAATFAKGLEDFGFSELSSGSVFVSPLAENDPKDPKVGALPLLLKFDPDKEEGPFSLLGFFRLIR